VVAFIIMVLATSVPMVGARTSGTLDRLLPAPLKRGELVGGYELAFGLDALVQSVVTSDVALGPLLMGGKSIGVVVVFAVLDALLGTALGLLMSAFARTEFQAVQFMPAIVLPQLLLCGLLNPRENMAELLRWISNVLPLSYATDAFSAARFEAGLNGAMWRDAAVLVG